MPNDIPNSTWNETDASNTAPVPNGAPEGWFPSDVNNWGRQCMGATKRFWDHINITETTGGTSTAYTLTYDVAPQQLWNGELFGFILDQTCGAAPTLNVNALGAKSLRRWNGSAWVALAAGEIVANQVLVAYYNSSGSGSYDIVTGFKDAVFSGGTLTSTTTMSGAAFNGAVRVDVASATPNIGAAASNYVRITGSSTIAAFDTVASGVYRDAVFAAVLQLTHGATLDLPNNGANITTAAGDRAGFISNGSGNWECLWYERANGAPLSLNTTYAEYTTYATFAPTIPGDNSIPQVGEGTQILTASITPKSTTSKVRVSAQAPLGLGSGGSADIACMALFRNGGANAIDSKFIRLVDGSATYPAVILFEDVPGATTAQTYTIRVGANSANISVNGVAGGRLGGGSSRASITLEEIPQ